MMNAETSNYFYINKKQNLIRNFNLRKFKKKSKQFKKKLKFRKLEFNKVATLKLINDSLLIVLH